jgi:hypothetical protein
MNASLKRPLIALFICVFCFTTTKTASAGVLGTSDGKTAGVIIALVGVGVLIGVGVYFAVHHGHSLKGCASSGPGDRIRVSGKKQKRTGGGRQFVATKLSKDYGPCKIQASTP